MRYLLFAVLLVSLLMVPTQDAQAKLSQTVCWIYEVEVDGTMIYGSSSKNFVQTGYLAVTAGINNSVNDSNIVVILGSPVTDPSAGALAFVTNGYFIGSLKSVYRTGALDLATVESWMSEYGSAVFEATIPDDFASDYGISQGLMANVFNWNSGLTANVKLVTGGSMWAEFLEDGTTNGSIGFVGRDWTSQRNDISYQADIKGTYVSESPSYEDCVITSR